MGDFFFPKVAEIVLHQLKEGKERICKIGKHILRYIHKLIISSLLYENEYEC